MSAPQLATLRDALREHDAAAFLTTDPDQQMYLVGFRALIYSRPIVLVVGREHTTLIVPELEDAHAREFAQVDDVQSYNERPGATTPGSHVPPLDALLAALPTGSRIAIDDERLSLAHVLRVRAHGHNPIDLGTVMRDLRARKHPHEVAAIRAAGELVAVGVRASLAACRPGVSELEIDAAGTAAIQVGATGFGPDATVELLTMTPSGVHRSTLPHVFSTTRALVAGDVLIHTRQVALNGYRAELERTAIVGAPSGPQARAFGTMLDAQQAAIEALRPGVAACDVDRAARDVIERAGYGQYAIHRSGHGIAIGITEHPHLRHDNAEPLLPGMVVTIEPGFYVPGLGGFRHSDTLLVTDDGAEPLTEHPRSLEALTLAAD
ncbi:MAG: Xaa-Pro peptidase family protein [Conexibacter sp.]